MKTRPAMLIRLTLLLVLVAACQGPMMFTPPVAATPGGGPGNETVLVVSVEGAGASGGSRTLVPAVAGLVASYSVVLEGPSGAKTISGTASPFTIPGLTPGAWTITVSGFDAPGNLVARSAPTPVTVTADQTVTATVALSFLQSGGTGAIQLTVSFPHTVGITSADATLGGAALALVLGSDGTTDTVTLAQGGVAAGSPLLRVFLKKADVVLAGVTESVWVFQNVTTAATVTLGAGDFGVPPAAPSALTAVPQHDGTVLLSWTANSPVADAYVVRRKGPSDASFGTISPDLAFDAASYVDHGPANTTYSYQVTAKNRFGESAWVGASATTFAVADAPVFSPGSGAAVKESDAITVTAVAGASVYYTTDGSAPSLASALSQGSILLSGLTSPVTLKALAVKNGMTDSAVATATYTINKKPVIASVARTGTGTVYRRGTSTAATAVTLVTTASDPEGAALTYGYTFTTGTLTATGTVTSSSTTSTGATAAMIFTRLGITKVTVTATDQAGNTATSDFSVNVADRPPTGVAITVSGGAVTNNGTDSKTLSVTATDPDADDLPANFTYAFSSSGPGTVYANGSNALFVTGTQAGVTTVVVTVSDGNGALVTSGYQTVKIATITTSGWGKTLPTAASLPARVGPLVSQGNSGQDVYIFDGQAPGSGTLYQDAWYYSMTGNLLNSWFFTHAPSARMRAAMVCYAPTLVGAVAFGGWNGTAALSDLWTYDGNDWTQQTGVTGTAPPAMADVSFVCTEDGIVYLLGSDGYMYKLTLPTDAHPGYAAAWTKSAAPAPLSARSGYGAVYDRANTTSPASGNIYYFGGLSGSTSLNDVWKFAVTSESWTQVSPGGADTSNTTYPSPRYGPSAVLDGSGNMVIFGGNSGGSAMNDLWKYALGPGTWTNLYSNNGPSPRYYHKALVYSGAMMVVGTLTGTGDVDTYNQPIFWKYYF